MDELEMPHALSSPSLQTDDALGEQVVPVSVASVEIVGRRLGGKIDVAQLLIRRHRCPYTGVARVTPRILLPRLIPELARSGDCVKNPEPLAGAHVISA